MKLWRRKGAVLASVFGWIESIEQRVELCPDALTHMRGYRQLTARTTEAGGQLFGTITAELIQISKVLGPYAADERSRYRYRSDPAAAQQSILQQSRTGLLYLGEWHTHAEDKPKASGLDDQAMRLLLERSRLNSNALLMLIVGRGTEVDSLALWTVAPDRVYQWAFE